MTEAERQDGSAIATDLLQRISRAVGESARVSAVFGEPVDREGITVIPVAKARFGFGGGADTGEREKKGGGGGGGGGAAVTPVGYIEIHDRTARFRRIPNPLELAALVAAASLAVLVIRRVV